MKKSLKRKCLYFLLIMLAVPMSVLASVQEQRVNLEFSNAPLAKVLDEVGRQTSLSVVYNVSDIADYKQVSVQAKNEDVGKVLSRVLKGTTLSYSLSNGHIVLSKKNGKVDVLKQSGATVSVKGNVKDATGEPLIGVSILVKGTTNGTVTDIDGNFTLQAEKGAVLEISYIGYTTQTVTVTGAPVNIVMKEDSEQLEEVVVTALGIKRSEKALSYNVQKVGGDELTAIKDANFMNSLNGKVAGVNIQRSASGVGGSTRVVMRGNKSIAGDNNVLYVVDGIPIGNQANREGDGSAFDSKSSSEGIANFNPDDIESISVLTGPSAAALYGASAANGVILINTKKGKEGTLRVNVASSVEFSNPFVLPKFQNVYGNADGSYFSWGNKLDTPASWEPEDFYKTGAMFSNSFNLSVGSEKNQTYISGAAVNSNGIIENNKYNRYNLTFRNTAKFLKDKLTLDFSASYVREYYNNMISSDRKSVV